MPQPQPLHILLLCESEAMAALDRRALREAGADRVECITSGVAAARMLAGLDPAPPSFQPDVAVCSQRLSDMDGEQFCAILRLHPLLLDLPILLILPNDSEVEQLKTLGCGASALLARPYSISLLKSHLDSLAASRASLEQLDKAGRLADTKDFDNALATYGILLKPVRHPEDFFRVGMQCLEQHKWNNAINAFQRALRGALIQGKAELGMAAAWRGKGDMGRYRHYLAQAASTFVRARQWNRARAVYARLLQEDPSARSPFLSEAMQCMRSGDYDKAADILAQGYEVTPRQQISEKIAQMCLAAEEPQSMLQNMETSLERSLGADAEALAVEVRCTLDGLVKEAEAKRLEDAAERQWRAARQASRSSEEPSGTEAPQAQAGPTPQMQNAETLPLPGQAAGPTKAPRPAARQRGAVGIALADEMEQEPAPQTGHSQSYSASQLRAGQGSSSPVVSLWGEQDKATSQAPSRPAEAAPTAVESQPDGVPPHLDPLAKGATSVFNSKASLTDLLSVVKFTWQMARRK